MGMHWSHRLQGLNVLVLALVLMREAVLLTGCLDLSSKLPQKVLERAVQLGLQCTCAGSLWRAGLN